MALSFAVGELICSLIAKAGELSNFRLERDLSVWKPGLAIERCAPHAGCQRGDPGKDRPLARGAARRARKLDGEAPRWSS
jgi:hypothetical protein